MGLTRTNAVKMSVRRWEEEVIKRLEHGDAVSLDDLNSSQFTDCGLCEFQRSDQGLLFCIGCPLSPDICYNIYYSAPTATFWKFCDLTTAEEQLPLAREILEAIKVRGTWWIAKGKRK